MEAIYKSASKLVFVMLATTACVAFLIGILDTANFMILAGGAFSFYFANKGDSSSQYLGK